MFVASLSIIVLFDYIVFECCARLVIQQTNCYYTDRFLYYIFTLWTDQRYTSTQSHWLTCISAVCALEPFSWPWARRHKWRHRSLSPSRGWLETANEQTTSTRIILRFVIIGHSYTVSIAGWLTNPSISVLLIQHYTRPIDRRTRSK